MIKYNVFKHSRGTWPMIMMKSKKYKKQEVSLRRKKRPKCCHIIISVNNIIINNINIINLDKYRNVDLVFILLFLHILTFKYVFIFYAVWHSYPSRGGHTKVTTHYHLIFDKNWYSCSILLREHCHDKSTEFFIRKRTKFLVFFVSTIKNCLLIGLTLFHHAC